jgi:hypothetical protein
MLFRFGLLRHFTKQAPVKVAGVRPSRWRGEVEGDEKRSVGGVGAEGRGSCPWVNEAGSEEGGGGVAWPVCGYGGGSAGARLGAYRPRRFRARLGRWPK